MGQIITILNAAGTPVNQAIVVMKNLETKQETITITNASGTVPFEAGIKKVQLFISHVSFENHVDTLDLQSGDIEIRLVDKKVNLGEVVVTSEYVPRASGESVQTVNVINKE